MRILISAFVVVCFLCGDVTAQGLLARLRGETEVKAQPYYPPMNYPPMNCQPQVQCPQAQCTQQQAQVRYIVAEKQVAVAAAAPAPVYAQAQPTAVIATSGNAPVTMDEMLRYNYYMDHLRALQNIAVETKGIKDEFARFNARVETHWQKAPVTIQPVPTTPTQPVTIQPVLPGPVPQGMLPFKRMQNTTMDCPGGICDNLPLPNPTSAFSVPTTPTLYDTTKKLLPGPAAHDYRTEAKALVRIESAKAPFSRWGSGCHIGHGYILTCAHILRRGWEPFIITSTQVKWPCEILNTDALLDLAILRVKNHEVFNAQAIYIRDKASVKDDPVQLQGTRDSFRAWPGKVVGYFGNDLIVKDGRTKEGDSGGPITLGNSIVSVINECATEDSTTMGPNVDEIRKFINSTDGITLKQRK
jgi:S1-C subfamily serine protease